MTKAWTKSEYCDETFVELDHRDQSYEDIEFIGCTFERVQFSASSFLRCKFIDCTFRGCDASTAKFQSSVLRDVKFEDCKVIGIIWCAIGTVQRLNFKNCLLNFGNFSGLDLRKCVFLSCIARELDLTQTNLAEADLRGCDFSGTRFLRTNLTKADLREARNYAIRPADNSLSKARFSWPEAISLLHGLEIDLEL